MQLRISKETALFFDLLPKEWQESIDSSIHYFKDNATLYLLEENNTLLAGGIVFSKHLPEMDAYREEANYWFSNDYLYIGYVWVPFEKRNNNYGSLWFTYLFKKDPTQHYWLTTEETSLRYFYEKMGFTFLKTLRNGDVQEELFIV